MKDLCLFLNTRIENPNRLAQAADWCLSPVRYMCNGHTARVQWDMQGRLQVDHVQSFHSEPHHQSKTNPRLESTETSMFKTIGAIALFVPGLFLGVILKTFAYLSEDTRVRHHYVKLHYTPINREIGRERPVETVAELTQALVGEFANTPHHQPTDALIIHGRNLQILQDPGILRFNPMKLILDGVSFAGDDVPCPQGDRLIDVIRRENQKWSGAPPIRTLPGEFPRNEYFIGEALRDQVPLRSVFPCKKWHRVYFLLPEYRNAAAAV